MTIKIQFVKIKTLRKEVKLWKSRGFIYKIGVERESLRCTKKGDLSSLPHPEVFGDRMQNNFITTDFGEAQLEIRTPVCNTVEECYNKLDNITDVVIFELNKQNELLWPYSMPCNLPAEKDFNFGNYGKNIEEEEYEMQLYKKYGYKMHCISGVHVNFSINKNFYKKLRKEYHNLPSDIDDAYFKIMREFMKKAWVLLYLLGATPLQCENDCRSTISLRNSNSCGFKTNKKLNIDFSNKIAYINSIKKLLENGDILNAREVYIPIRAKSKDKNNVLDDLLTQKVDHIEVRLVDLNPFDKCGISKKDLDLVITFLFYCLLTNDDYSLDYKEVAENGITEEQRIILIKTLNEFKKINKDLGLDCNSGIEEMLEVSITGNTKAQRIEKLAGEKGLMNVILDLANTYLEDSELHRYCLKQYPKLESSTVAVIKDAIKAGIDYNVISEEKNFVEYTKNKRKKCVIQATKTNVDSYIFPYITDDKLYAKKIMRDNKLNVPSGLLLNKKDSKLRIKKVIKEFINIPCVVKPRTTNCGIGITVFDKPTTETQLIKAIKYAFKFDNDILIEEFASGREYRFVIVDGKCLNIVWRRSASVVGDGKSTIKQLIDIKSKEPWHVLLENPMVIDQPLMDFLKKQNYSFDYIPENGQRVFLRENSNCSTGGESVDVTELIPERFKKIAEKAAKVFNARICGVDIIIGNLHENDYTIIEINDNPGICINEWPYEGRGEQIGTHILKLLKLA